MDLRKPILALLVVTMLILIVLYINCLSQQTSKPTSENYQVSPHQRVWSGVPLPGDCSDIVEYQHWGSSPSIGMGTWCGN